MLIVNNRWLNLGNLEAGTVHKVEQAVACAEYARRAIRITGEQTMMTTHIPFHSSLTDRKVNSFVSYYCIYLLLQGRCPRL